MESVKQNGLALQYASSFLKIEKKFCVAALKQMTKAWTLITPKVRKDNGFQRNTCES